MKPICMGVSSFKEMMTEGWCYVDKTRFIAKHRRRHNEAYLITRPRRFGKTLNLSTMDAYYNLKYRGNEWFDDLEVSKLLPNDGHKNAHPVISISFKDLGFNPENFKENLVVVLRRLYMNFPELEDSPYINHGLKEMYRRFMTRERNNSEMSWSLLLLSKMLHAHYTGVSKEEGMGWIRPRPIILIDEYDWPTNSMETKEDREEVQKTMTMLLSSALTENEHLEFGVLVGITQYTGGSIASGLDNIMTDSIFDSKFSDCFGFTLDEVRKLCEDAGRPEKFEEAKQWYDGYSFGNDRVLNPWSVMNYVQDGFVPKPYWVNTGGISIISDMLRAADDFAFGDLKKLVGGEGVVCVMNRAVSYDKIKGNYNNLISMMVVSGYLGIVLVNGYMPGPCIPNKELVTAFRKATAHMIRSNTSVPLIHHFSDALLREDADGMKDSLGKLLKTLPVDWWDTEHAYDFAVLYLLLTLDRRYAILSECRSYGGRADIALYPRAGEHPNLLMEVKRCEGCDLKRMSEEALERIEERGYYNKFHGRTFLLGMAFDSSRSEILLEVRDLP